VVVKRFYFPKLKYRLERWLRVDRYSRSVRSQAAVHRAGVSTPALYAHGLSGSRLAPDYAFLVFDALQHTARKQLLDCYMAAGIHRHRYSRTVLPFWLQWGLRRFDRRLR